MNHSSDLHELSKRVAGMNPKNCRIVVGFDGFVDEMISLVDQRHSLEDFTPVSDIATFGALVSTAAGQSSLREIVVNATHPGGCAVNLADGLASMGAIVDCYATLGTPIHPAFADIAAKCHSTHTWGREPGRTLAFEFDDGKLMFSSVKQLGEFTPDAVLTHLTDGHYANACNTAQVIALTDWSLYPHMTAVWRLLQHEVYAGLTHRPHFFIDLVDPSSRSQDDIREMANLLKDFEAYGPVTLGLNGNEANLLCGLLGLPCAGPDAPSEELLDQAFGLRKSLSVHQVVIHRIRIAVSASDEGGFLRHGPYCAKPQKSTGAGDRFNAGFCLGLASEFNSSDSLALACAVSGFFVRNARSPELLELAEFLNHWADDSL